MKHTQTALFTPSDYIAYARSTGRYPDSDTPHTVVFCYNRALKEFILSNHRHSVLEKFHPELHVFDDYPGLGLVGHFGIGAPVASVVMEELIALGTKRFIHLGTAGSLQKHVEIGDLILCDRALRDEGVSRHYLPPGRFSEATTNLTDHLADALTSSGIEVHRGSVWTTDAPYRETIEDVKAYQAEGLLAVEMELAALFAVAKYRGVEIAAVLSISDSLANLKWQPEFHSNETRVGLETLWDGIVSSLF